MAANVASRTIGKGGWDPRILPRCANSPGNGRFIRKNWHQRAHGSARRRQESSQHIQHKWTFDPYWLGKPLGKPPGDANQFKGTEQASRGHLPSQQLDVWQVDTDRHGGQGGKAASWPGRQSGNQAIPGFSYLFSFNVLFQVKLNFH